MNCSGLIQTIHEIKEGVSRQEPKVVTSVCRFGIISSAITSGNSLGICDPRFVFRTGNEFHPASRTRVRQRLIDELLHHEPFLIHDPGDPTVPVIIGLELKDLAEKTLQW